MRRGDIYLVDLDPSRGSEARKTRPCVIVTTDTSNTTVERLRRGVVVVVPLTSNTDRVFSFQVFVPASKVTGLTSDSKAQVEQVRAVDVQRLVHRIGCLDAAEVTRVNAALRTHLDL